MGVQRYTHPSGAVRYRARVKSQGQKVAARVFDRKADAVAWEQDQRRRLRLGEWVDPRRGRVPLSVVAADWLSSRSSVKRRTRESDQAAWRNYIQPRFGNWPIASITRLRCRPGSAVWSLADWHPLPLLARCRASD